jgi:hypothetical protein
MPHVTQVTLWTLGMSGNAVECEARAHPLGVELCYVLNDRLLMSRVYDSWDRLSSQAQTWRNGLEGRGWSQRPEDHLPRPSVDLSSASSH